VTVTVALRLIGAWNYLFWIRGLEELLTDPWSATTLFVTGALENENFLQNSELGTDRERRSRAEVVILFEAARDLEGRLCGARTDGVCR